MINNILFVIIFHHLLYILQLKVHFFIIMLFMLKNPMERFYKKRRIEYLNIFKNFLFIFYIFFINYIHSLYQIYLL